MEFNWTLVNPKEVNFSKRPLKRKNSPTKLSVEQIRSPQRKKRQRAYHQYSEPKAPLWENGSGYYYPFPLAYSVPFMGPMYPPQPISSFNQGSGMNFNLHNQVTFGNSHDSNSTWRRFEPPPNLCITMAEINGKQTIRDGHFYPLDITTNIDISLHNIVKIQPVYLDPPQLEEGVAYVKIKIHGLKKPPQKVYGFKDEVDIKQKGRIRINVRFDCRPRSFLQSFPNGSSVKMDIQLTYLSTSTKCRTTNFGPIEFRFNPNNSTPKRGKFWVLTPTSYSSDNQHAYVLGQNFGKVIRVFFDSTEAEVMPPLCDDKSCYASWRQVKIPTLEQMKMSATKHVVNVTIQQKTRKGKWEEVEGVHQFNYNVGIVKEEYPQESKNQKLMTQLLLPIEDNTSEDSEPHSNKLPECSNKLPECSNKLSECSSSSPLETILLPSKVPERNPSEPANGGYPPLDVTDSRSSLGAYGLISAEVHMPQDNLLEYDDFFVGLDVPCLYHSM